MERQLVMTLCLKGAPNLLDLVHQVLGRLQCDVLQGELQRRHAGLVRLHDLQTHQRQTSPARVQLPGGRSWDTGGPASHRLVRGGLVDPVQDASDGLQLVGEVVHTLLHQLAAAQRAQGLRGWGWVCSWRVGCVI